MSHDHHDHRSLGITSLNKAFVIGIVLNAGFVVAEFIAGFWYNSLGLISDAGHNLGDVFSLVLAMLAFRLAKVSPTLRYTYGYKKSTILVSLLNAVILLVAVGFILGESIDKLFHPRPVDGDAVAWVAGVGVLVNALTAWLFVKDKEKDLNVKGAYLHGCRRIGFCRGSCLGNCYSAYRLVYDGPVDRHTDRSFYRLFHLGIIAR